MRFLRIHLILINILVLHTLSGWYEPLYTFRTYRIHMVKARIDIDDRTNRVLNVVRAMNNLRDKSEAIDFVVKDYAEKVLVNNPLEL